MSVSSSRSASRRWIASLVLAAVALRALVPAGFMPAPGRLALEICPDGLPAGVLGAMHHAHELSSHDDLMADEASDAHEHMAHAPPGGGHHPGGAQSHLEHCLFGSASAAGPVPHGGCHVFARSAVLTAAVAFSPQRTGGHPAYVPSPRGPPLSA